MLQSRRTSCFVVDSSKTQAHHESPQCHVGAFVVWNLPIGLQRSRSQLEFEVNLRPKFRGNPGFRGIPVWRCRRRDLPLVDPYQAFQDRDAESVVYTYSHRALAVNGL